MRKQDVSEKYQDRGVVEAYDQSRFYSLSGRYKNWRLRKLIMRILKLVPNNGIVLDIPCGTGRIDNWLLRAPVRVIASDISSEMLSKTRDKVRPTSSWLGLILAEAGHLPFRPKCIDCVFSIRFFHLLDREVRLAILNEFSRVAKKWVIVEYRRIDSPIKIIKRTVVRWLTGRVEKPKMAFDHIAEEVSKCGLTVEEYYYINRWFSGSIIVRARCPEL